VRQLEEVLVSDLFFVLQGLDGNHIMYSDSKAQYEVEPAMAEQIPIGYLTLALQVGIHVTITDEVRWRSWGGCTNVVFRFWTRWKKVTT
jgi:hypothetical protein